MSNNSLRNALANTVKPPSSVTGRPTPKLRTRKPTGKPSWPLVLIEGGEKTGKSWAAAEFTASNRIGSSYWLDWHEGSADEYAAIPGSKYEVIDHNGTWPDIVGQVEAVAHEAARALADGEPPVLLVIDSMTAEWEHLKSWANYRACSTDNAKLILERNPNAEIPVSMNLWNDANDRHYRLMRILMRFPGIVVITARGKEVAAIDEKGRPVQNQREYRVEGHKNLAYDASAWVRLSRKHAPEIIGARSVHAGIRPGKDKPRQVPHFSLEWLVFEVLLKETNGVGGQTRNLPDPDHSRDNDEAESSSVTNWKAAIDEAGQDANALRQLFEHAKDAGADRDVLHRIHTALENTTNQ